MIASYTNRPDFFSQPWLMNKQYAMGYMPALIRILDGAEIHTSAQDNARYKKCTQTVNISGEFGAAPNIVSSTQSDEIEPDSIAIIPIHGPIMKEDGWCTKGIKTVVQEINWASNHRNIKGIILHTNSGGGAANACDLGRNAVLQAKTKKPVINWIEDYNCSAMYYISAAANETYASNKRDTIGSIGTMLSFIDPTGYYEAKGYKFHEVYSSKSSLKNKKFRDARRGDYEQLIKEVLDPYANDFISVVQTDRADKLVDNKAIFQGETWFAADAIELGLIDGICSLSDAIERVHKLAESNNYKNSHSKSNTMFGQKYPKLSALKNVKAEDITPETIQAANNELADQNIPAFLLVASKEIPNADALEAHLEKAHEELNSLKKQNASLASSSETISSMESQITDLKKQIASLTNERDEAQSQTETLKQENSRLSEKLNGKAASAHHRQPDGKTDKDGDNTPEFYSETDAILAEMKRKHAEKYS